MLKTTIFILTFDHCGHQFLTLMRRWYGNLTANEARNRRGSQQGGDGGP
jgi:hypothetical protein